MAEIAASVLARLKNSELFNKVTLNPENAENRLSFLNKQNYFQCEFHTKLNRFKMPYLKDFWVFSVTFLKN